MTSFTRFLAAAAAIGGFAAPAAAQYSPYPQQYPQAYPQQYPQAYPQQYGTAYPGQPYGYGNTYGNSGTVGAVIDSLLGNRYNANDRTAVSQCAGAAMTQAAAQYRGGYGQQGYGQQGYGGYNRGAAMRVTAITDVQRRSSGLRVKGLMSSGYGGQYGGQYGQQGYGYSNQGYAGSDLSFRCNVDYRGAVTNVRISRNTAYRR